MAPQTRKSNRLDLASAGDFREEPKKKPSIGGTTSPCFLFRYVFPSSGNIPKEDSEASRARTSDMCQTVHTVHLDGWMGGHARSAGRQSKWSTVLSPGNIGCNTADTAWERRKRTRHWLAWTVRCGDGTSLTRLLFFHGYPLFPPFTRFDPLVSTHGLFLALFLDERVWREHHFHFRIFKRLKMGFLVVSSMRFSKKRLTQAMRHFVLIRSLTRITLPKK